MLCSESFKIILEIENFEHGYLTKYSRERFEILDLCTQSPKENSVSNLFIYAQVLFYEI